MAHWGPAYVDDGTGGVNVVDGQPPWGGGVNVVDGVNVADGGFGVGNIVDGGVSVADGDFGGSNIVGGGVHVVDGGFGDGGVNVVDGDYGGGVQIVDGDFGGVNVVGGYGGAAGRSAGVEGEDSEEPAEEEGDGTPALLPRTTTDVPSLCRTCVRIHKCDRNLHRRSRFVV